MEGLSNSANFLRVARLPLPAVAVPRCLIFKKESKCLILVSMLVDISEGWGNVDLHEDRPVLPFVGDHHWKPNHKVQCEVREVRHRTRICTRHFWKYQWLDTEVLKEEPVLLVFRNLFSKRHVAKLLEDAKQYSLQPLSALDNNGKPMRNSAVRIANGTWIRHDDTDAFEKAMRRAEAMIPHLSRYTTGDHFAPHYDYLNFEMKGDLQMMRYGNRFATFYVVLQNAIRGGRK
ncbi:unnamed protein product [Nippostrongylus brasiliensis]|uniref:2OG-FeII_Oxy_4 domain-containing protein n=1 Tax=Nippostrongylus brasiliensis TaxID=27835 RepID=A0A158R230_NIPBR|nr:unnamed protein product [Nippostrongylus brasiliensis]